MTTIIGLTGSIAMGKSTVAGMFRDMHVPVFDADAVVRDMIAYDTSVRAKLHSLFGTTDRNAIGKIVFNDSAKRDALESILHPRVADSRTAFLKANQTKDIVVLDIPLLFEKGIDSECDTTVVVTAPPEIQEKRALQRGGMTRDRFQAILKTQMPDHEKQSKADHVIHTHMGLPHTAKTVRHIVNLIRKKQ